MEALAFVCQHNSDLDGCFVHTVNSRRGLAPFMNSIPGVRQRFRTLCRPIKSSCNSSGSGALMDLFLVMPANRVLT
jgi:hypothetical protein